MFYDIKVNFNIWRHLMSYYGCWPYMDLLKDDFFTHLGRTDDMVESYLKSERNSSWYKSFYH